MIRIGFTGTREGMTYAQQMMVREILTMPYVRQFDHGDCFGADEQAHDLAVLAGLRTVAHPPLDSTYRAHKRADFIHPPLPYLLRNQNIVEATNVLVATPRTEQEQLRSGTWATIRYAAKRNRHSVIVFPSGKCSCDPGELLLQAMGPT